MSLLRRSLSLLTVALLAAAAFSSEAAGQEADLVQVTTEIAYDLSAEEGPVNVTWQINVVNNDPETVPEAEDGTLTFYDNLIIPVLQGAESVTALDAAGESLSVTLEENSNGPVDTARIDFAERIFFEETYQFGVRYEIPATRGDSVLVTPAYMFLPIVASGDEAMVRIVTPPEGAWSSIVEARDCERDGDIFRCSGSDNVYIAATAEASRPDAVSTVQMQAELPSGALNVSFSYFEGEEETAQHLQGLIPAALPVIEELFGFPYNGPENIEIRQGSREAVLGYEGITQCSGSGCEIRVSPVADDITIIHELTHLWTGIFAERWLSEGFAQLYAEEAAAMLPAELVRTRPEPTIAEAVDLPLDYWGEVQSVIEATADRLALEEAGYNLSLRFMETLRQEVGSSVLRDVNIAIAESGETVNSRRYMDLLEDTSGRNLDEVFLTWVFPEEESEVIQLRRQARDRLAELELRALSEGLPEGATAGVRELILDWDFAAALTRLDSIDADIETYNDLSTQLSRISEEAASIGLTMPVSVAEALDRWEFGNVRLALADSRDALDTYRAARAAVNADRDLWERFGLLGSDPDSKLDEAAEHFEVGQFQTSIDSSRSAMTTVNDASSVALRRILIVTGIFAAFGILILAAVWASHLRDRQLADR